VTFRRDAPAFYVKVAIPGGGKAALVDLTDRVIAFTFDEEESKADKLELDLNNFDLALFDDPHWRHGNTLTVAWGYVGNMTAARKMIIGKITGAKVLKVEALAPSILMNKDQKSRTFSDQSTAQIVKAIADAYGLPIAEEMKGEAAYWAVKAATQQANVTDAQLLASVARRHGYVFNVKADGLHFAPRNVSAGPIRQFIYYTDPGQGDVLDFNIENDVTMIPGGIVAKGRDREQKKDIHEVASNTETKRPGVAPNVQTVSKRDLQPRPAPKPVAAPAPATDPTAIVDPTNIDFSHATHVISNDQAVSPAAVPAAPKVAAAAGGPIDWDHLSANGTHVITNDRVVTTTAQTAAQAKAQADAKFTRAQQAAVKLSLSVVGDPRVGATNVIEVLGISKRLSGKYYVKSAKHKLSATSYTLDLACHSDGVHGVATAVEPRSDASPNTKPLEAAPTLKPTVVFVDGRSLTTYRK
jgi:phage protein D